MRQLVAGMGKRAAGEWIRRALCIQVDPELFFPDQAASSRAAKEVCRQCPVIAECLALALANNERFGVWGGMSEEDRRRMRRGRRGRAG